MTCRLLLFAAVLIAAGSSTAGFSVGAAAQGSASAPQAAGGAAVEVATFASGCFWCTEADFDKVPGVISTTSGYTGGRVANPTYEQVSSGGTGHTEAVEVRFDPSKVSYEQLLDTYWHNVDPFTSRGQFCDFGEQYRPTIFVHNAAQRTAAEGSKEQMKARFSRPIVVTIENAGAFYPAEAYHQDFHSKSSVRYNYYRWGCGRDARLAEIWGEDAPPH